MAFETCGYSITSIFCGLLVLLFIIYKISPGTHIFQRSFLRVLFLEWGICVTKLIGLAYTYKISRKKCYRIVFALFYYFILGKFPPGALYSERRFNGRFCYKFWEGLIFQNLTVILKTRASSSHIFRRNDRLSF